MKLPMIALLGIASLASSAFAAEERVANFQSQDGRKFSIRYELNETVRPGDSVTRAVTWLQIETPYFGGADVNAALIDKCYDETSRAYEGQQVHGGCRLGQASGGAPLASNFGDCQVSQSFAQEVGFDFSPIGPGSILTSHRVHGGGGQICHQQVVVQVNGQYLVDPINGSHNFNFDFDY